MSLSVTELGRRKEGTHRGNKGENRRRGERQGQGMKVMEPTDVGTEGVEGTQGT